VTNIITITCDKFFGDWLRGVNSVGGPNFAISHWQAQLPLPQGWSAVNTCLVLLCSPWWYSLRIFVLNSGLWKFRNSISVVKTCYLLSSTNVDAESMHMCMRAWVCICVCNGLGWCDNWISGARHCHWLWAQWRFNIAYLLNSIGLLLLAYSYTLQSIVYGTTGVSIWPSLRLIVLSKHHVIVTLGLLCHFCLQLHFMTKMLQLLLKSRLDTLQSCYYCAMVQGVFYRGRTALYWDESLWALITSCNCWSLCPVCHCKPSAAAASLGICQWIWTVNI